MLNQKSVFCSFVLLLQVLSSSVQSECHFPPFLTTMQYGFHMQRSLFLAEPSMLSKSNEPMIEFTCNVIRWWTNGFGDDETSFDIPDQVELIEQKMTHEIDFDERVYIDVAQLKREMSRRTGLSYAETVGMSSHTYRFKKYRDAIVMENKIVFEHFSKIHVTRVKLNKDALKLGYKLHDEYEMLKRTNNKSHPLFEDGTWFYPHTLDKFGSHIALDAEFGSYIWQSAFIDSFFLEDHGREWISRMLRKHLKKTIRGRGINWKGEPYQLIGHYDYLNEDEEEEDDDEYYRFISQIELRLCQYNSVKQFSGCTDDVPKWSFNNASISSFFQSVPYSDTFIEAKLLGIENLFPFPEESYLKIVRDVLFANSDIRDSYSPIKFLLKRYKGLFRLKDENFLLNAYKQARHREQLKLTRKSIGKFKAAHRFVNRMNARLIVEQSHDLLNRLWKTKLACMENKETDQKYFKLQDQINNFRISQNLDPIEVDDWAVKIADFYYEHMTGGYCFTNKSREFYKLEKLIEHEEIIIKVLEEEQNE